MIQCACEVTLLPKPFLARNGLKGPRNLRGNSWLCLKDDAGTLPRTLYPTHCWRYLISYIEDTRHQARYPEHPRTQGRVAGYSLGAKGIRLTDTAVTHLGTTTEAGSTWVVRTKAYMNHTLFRFWTFPGARIVPETLNPIPEILDAPNHPDAAVISPKVTHT